MALEVEKSRRGSHGTDWGDESDSFATVVEIAGGLGFDSESDFLDWDVFARIGGVHYSGIWVSNHQEISLPWWTCILTPEPFQVDGTVITAITFKPKNTVDFNIRALLLFVIKIVAAALNTIVLWTLSQVENVNERVVGLV